MCGLAGSFRSDADVDTMLDRIAHRGPDGRGIVAEGDIVHGHVRLSLLDLSSRSDQPFRYESCLLSFNGELWNWRALRDELTSSGLTFSTESDTEVLAAAIHHWGLADTLPRLDGMFAFACSLDDGSAFLVRDRYGKVPIYAQRSGGSFTWASERKAWAAGSVAPIPAGAVLNLNDGTLTKWYDLPLLDVRRYPSLVDLLTVSVTDRLQADANVACLVSGGIDSSMILALAVRSGLPVTAYTAVLDESSTDLSAARDVCEFFGVTLNEVYVDPPTTERIEQAVATIETPMKAQVEIATLCIPLAERISADGFKACLSGEAADELFGGYGNMIRKTNRRTTDAQWRAIRVEQLDKMARGNFVRCNKAFMAHGVECRLPFMARPLVETVLSLSFKQCPPAKKALKSVAAGLLPHRFINRQKDTFQGASGMSASIARVISNPIRYYNAVARKRFGSITRG